MVLLLPERTRQHVLTAMGATPHVVQRLVECCPLESPAWDTVVPGRFTPREHIAHMADWEEVFFERLRLTVEEDEPIVPNPDETALSIERLYAQSDPREKAELFARRREALVEFLRARQPQDWARVGVHPKNGRMSLEAQAVHVIGHDGYHLDFLARMLR